MVTYRQAENLMGPMYREGFQDTFPESDPLFVWVRALPLIAEYPKKIMEEIAWFLGKKHAEELKKLSGKNPGPKM
jgi:hypothetical protein